MPRFVISDPQKRTQIFEIYGPSVTIGRSESNDLVLDDPSVSRRHAKVSLLTEHHALVLDLGSLNGVLVNGVAVKEHPLTDQDSISIGIYDLRYEMSADRVLEIAPGSQASVNIPDTAVLQSIRVGTPEHADRQSLRPVAGRIPADIVSRINDLESEVHRLKLLLSVGKMLTSVLVPQEIMQRLMDLVFQMNNVERGFLMLRDEKGGFKAAHVVYKHGTSGSGTNTADPRTIVLSKKLIERISSERLPLLIRNLQDDARFTQSESLRVSGVRSAMCAPVIFKDNFFGILYVDCLSKAMAFSPEELGVLAVIAAQAAVSLDNARAHEELSRDALERSALKRFLSPPVVTRILEHPGEVQLGGETQTATILFSDIRNFTRMAERIDPQDVVHVLNEFFSLMTDVIFETGGTLDKYLGDGLMALYGAPIPHPDDPQRAVKAAIEMKRRLACMKRNWRLPAGSDFRIGIGINTGRVTAGNIGSPQRMDYTAIGDAVNVAARLCACAAGGQILVSEATFCELNTSFPARQCEPVVVKGRETPVAVYEILWESFSP